MNALKKLLSHIFIDGLSGMAIGLFATLVIGTIAEQIGTLVGGSIGEYIVATALLAKILTGAGIGVGVAYKYKASALVTLSAATAGLSGAFASGIISGGLLSEGTYALRGPGEPMGAFVAAFVAIEIGMLVSGKTKLDILITPFVSIGAGSFIGFMIGPPIAGFIKQLGELINMGAHNHPIVMGILVSVLMGMILTSPISSAALGVMLGLGGIAAGAATVGCAANMVGFAVSSYKDNKVGGLLAQGLGTSMLQIPNIIKKPVIWLPPIIASAILGPVATTLLKMTNNPIGSGMGTSGLVGPIMTYQTMLGEGRDGTLALVQIVVMYFIAPALITWVIAEFMRSKGWIEPGDMELPMI